MAIIIEGRHDKAEKKLPLNILVPQMTVYSGSIAFTNIICSAKEDIAGTLKVANLEVISQKRADGRQINPYDVYIKLTYETKQ